jgi:UDP-glucose 4-epimerase
MQAVVIGGLGMIGSAVARYLIKEGTHTRVLDLPIKPNLAYISYSPLLSYQSCDIRNLEWLCGAISGAEEVYHFAGELGTSDMDDDIRGAVDTNIRGTINVYDACLAQGVQRIFNPTKPNVWLNTYTITKTCTESFGKLYNKLHGERISITQLRYFNAFGPDQHLFPVRKIVPSFMIQAMRGMPIEVYGDGEQTVDMIYVDDMARLTVQATRKRYRDQPLDCGSGQEMTVNQVARDINSLCNSTAGIRHLPMRRGEDPYTRLCANVRMLSYLLSDLRLTPWHEGLQKTWRWLQTLPAADIDRAITFYGWK